MNRRRYSVLAAAALAGSILTMSVHGVSAAPRVRPGVRLAAEAQVLRNVAQVEGVTPQVLSQDLQQGMTLLQIAGDKYADAGDLATALLAQPKTRLDTAVTAGTITAGQETVIYSMFLARTTTLVVTPHPVRDLIESDQTRIHAAITQTVTTVAGACNTTLAALTTLLRAGGTTALAACQQTNAAETAAALIAAIDAPIQAKLQAALGTGLITSAQELKLNTRIVAAIGRGITVVLPTWSTVPGGI